MRGMIMFLVALAAFLTLVGVVKRDFSPLLKCGVLASLVACAVLFVVSLKSDESQQNSVRELAQRFNSGEILRCGKFEVSQKTFNLEFGTQSFVSKNGTFNNGKVVSFSECEGVKK